MEKAAGGTAVVLNSSTIEIQVSEHPRDGRLYSWLEDYFPQLEGKEQRQEYYTRLERHPSAGKPRP